MPFDVEADGFDRFRQLLDDIATRANDLRPVLTDIGEDIQLVIDEAFRTEGASLGRRWAPLAPGYRKERQRRGKGTSILQTRGSRGGILRRSLTKRSGPQGIFTVGRDEVAVGTRLGIAPLMHRGGTRTLRYPSGKSRTYRIPARPVLPTAAHLRGRYGDRLGEFLVDGKRGRGL